MDTIITNNKLLKTRHSEWNQEKGCFVESSYSMYVSSFSTAVRRDPEKMVKLVIEHKDSVLPAFIDSLYSGLAISENIKKVPIEVIERLFREFPCDMETVRASYFSIIVKNLENAVWSEEVINQLKEIALNHKNPELEDDKASKKAALKSCRTLGEYALNSTRGHAIRAMSVLLWKDKNLFKQFKDTIDELTRNENPIIRFATLYALWSSYNIDRLWAEEKIMFLYESNIRMAGFHDSKDMFFRLYPKYGKRILKIIEQCLASTDKDLIELGGHAICEFYIRNDVFEEIIFDVKSKSNEQMSSILHMAVNYLAISDYREPAKAIILKYKDFDIAEGCPLSLIFEHKYIDSERDKEFLKALMKSKAGHRTTYAFTRFLKENAVSVLDYADIIFALCENVLQIEEDKLRGHWGIEHEISKLIIALYDETANSDRGRDKQIAARCLDLWDIMFEKQLGSVREISYKLMER